MSERHIEELSSEKKGLVASKEKLEERVREMSPP